MDPQVPDGMGNFFQGMIGDVLRMLHTDAPLQFDLALQLAHSVATENGDVANVEPIERIELENLARIADLHVSDVTGMTTGAGTSVSVRAVDAPSWARESLESWRSLFEEIALALRPDKEVSSEVLPNGPDENNDLSVLFSQFATAVGPSMIAMQIGSLVGHLAQRCLGQYELLLPRPKQNELLIVPDNLKRFASEWSLPAADVKLYCLVRDLAIHTVISRPHVHERLRQLLVAHASGIRLDPNALEDRLQGIEAGELGDLGAMTRFLADPSALAAIQDTPELRRSRSELTTLTATILGYVAWVTDIVADRAIGAGIPIREAMRRARVERSEQARESEALLGLELGQETIDRGESFIKGVLDRGAESELAKLFVIESHLPTPSEIDAPGLWIERINLPPAED